MALRNNTFGGVGVALKGVDEIEPARFCALLSHETG